jgi:hypothetical protein
MLAEVRTIVLRNSSSHHNFMAEWNSGDRTQIIHWNTMTNSSAIYHSVTLQTPALFSETSSQAEWGTLYYAMELVSVSASGIFR